MSELRAKAYEMVDKYFDAGGDPDCILMSQKDFRNSPAYKAELARVIGEDVPEAKHDQEEQWCVDAVNECLAEQRKRAGL